ncbi:hypothetical protein EDB86DRAFT_3097234 [Lactarius hatsudake]|nr:hypothetical protein EDB86DRAFT_3097234 [Lactarius hatsudake]
MFGFQPTAFPPTAFPPPLPPPFHTNTKIHWQVRRLERPGHRPPAAAAAKVGTGGRVVSKATSPPYRSRLIVGHLTCPHTRDMQPTPPLALCPTAATLADLLTRVPPRHRLNNDHCRYRPPPMPATPPQQQAARAYPLNRRHHHRRPPSTPATPPPTRLGHRTTPSRHAVINATTARLHVPRDRINTTALALASHQPRLTQPP